MITFDQMGREPGTVDDRLKSRRPRPCATLPYPLVRKILSFFFGFVFLGWSARMVITSWVIIPTPIGALPAARIGFLWFDVLTLGGGGLFLLSEVLRR